MAFHCCLEVCSYLGTAVLEGCSLADTVVQEEDCIPLFSMKIDMAMAGHWDAVSHCLMDESDNPAVYRARMDARSFDTADADHVACTAFRC